MSVSPAFAASCPSPWRTLLSGWMFALLLAILPLSLWAHAQQEGTWPEDGAVLEGSPESIGVQFDHEMRLTLFEVSGPAGRVALRDSPGQRAVQRFSTAPATPLPSGEYTVSWRGLAADGHVMRDSFVFTVR